MQKEEKQAPTTTKTPPAPSLNQFPNNDQKQSINPTQP
jgi:hypothetical protein